MDEPSSSVKSTVKSYSYQIRVFQVYPCDCPVRIEVLVLITAALMVVRYMLDMFRRRSTNQILIFLLVMLATLPYALLDYTIGLMQLTKSNNEVFQVWAVVLVTLRYSIRAVRPTGIFGKQNPLQDMMSSLWTANLLGTRTTLLRIPLWLLWSLNSVRIILGFADTELTSTRYGRHLRLLTEYMRTEHKRNPLEDCDAKDMKGYKYLVWGEDKQKVKSGPPDYKVRLEVTKEKKFITTDKVWEHNGTLFGKTNESNEFKDICLAFALFKLLRRRFFGLPFHEANQPKTKELVLKGLLQNNSYNRAFQIIEAELAFLNDFFFTRYAVMFARGFPTLRLVLSMSVIGVASYLALIFYYSSDRLAGDLSKTTNGVSVTLLLLIILAMKEIWEMVTYMLSDWTKVVLISNYIQQRWWTSCPALVAAARCLCKLKIANRWHGVLGQYNLLQSFQYLPWLKGQLYTRSRHVLFNRVLSKRYPGYQRSPQIAVPNEVKGAITKFLQQLYNQPGEALEKLPIGAKSLPNIEQKIQQTSEFPTETQKILVWHIATCYCEIKLGFPNLDPPEQKRLASYYETATALSQHAAYLLTLQTPLVPGRSLVATNLFRQTALATQQFLWSCRSCDEMIEKLDKLAAEKDDDTAVGGCRENDDDKDDKDGNGKQRMKWEERKRRRKMHNRSRIIEGEIILKIGVRLGKALWEENLREEKEKHTKLWTFLEEFWARYLLYLAASVTPAGHKQSLSGGGAFLTHVWALLTHAGVLGKTDQDRPSAVNDLIRDIIYGEDEDEEN
jgi:Domain of unknown function (DUF4220)/Protein of unknown function, DUF594